MTNGTRSAAYGLFVRENEILLGKRQNTGRWDGYFSPPCGGIKPNESILDGLIREVREEMGVTIGPEDANLAHVRHRRGEGFEAVQYYFRVTAWDGEITNAEPELCEGWEWHPIDWLPQPFVPHTAAVISLIHRGVRYSQSGW